MQEEKNNIGFNTACEQLKQGLIENINLSNLPIASIYFILQTVYYEVEKIYYGTLNEEAIQNPKKVELDTLNIDTENDSVEL